ncbi:pilus assembly protein PilO [Klebsiella pneumoniae]|uniref:HofO family protein n=1 Tax=Klebsiella pneumoniae TaxID=573 RepID=UPI001F0D618E|nr:pilus assembly protein PilO [Klebsiella pneumoniae]UMV24909.1 pilus assembly protein PilO [Klebsiella pneumoniae]
MRINLRGAWTGLPILLAMGLSGGGVALWRDLRPPQSFSPIAIPLSGAKLIAWRPQGSGGEMELTLSWSTVPALFSWLARCGMNPRSFSLGREAQTLRLRLLLEAEDER